MKTSLLYLLLIVSNISFGQDLMLEDFNNMSLGDISANATWETFYSPGQTNPTTTNHTNTNSQIVAEGLENTNGLKITGPNATTGFFFTWKNGLNTLWNSRNTGNDILEFDFSFKLESGDSSTNVSGIYLFNSDFSKILAGLIIRHSTREVLVVAYSDPPSVEQEADNYNYPLAADAGVIAPADTWVSFGISYNTTTGQILIDGDLVDGPLNLSTNLATDVPAEIDFVSLSGIDNTTASNIYFDNLRVKAVASNNILSVKDISNNLVSSLSVFPNPTVDKLNLETTLDVNSIEVFNYLGQSVLKKNYTKSAIDVSSLEKGVYFMSIKTTSGEIFSEKFIKK